MFTDALPRPTLMLRDDSGPAEKMTKTKSTVGEDVLLAQKGDRAALRRLLKRIGPDILAEDFDEDEAVRRFHPHGYAPIGVAILDQSILCGIGNVYKSEVLFRLGLDPFVAVRELTETDLKRDSYKGKLDGFVQQIAATQKPLQLKPQQ